jgi:hypothetical protein
MAHAVAERAGGFDGVMDDRCQFDPILCRNKSALFEGGRIASDRRSSMRE